MRCLLVEPTVMDETMSRPQCAHTAPAPFEADKATLGARTPGTPSFRDGSLRRRTSPPGESFGARRGGGSRRGSSCHELPLVEEAEGETARAELRRGASLREGPSAASADVSIPVTKLNRIGSCPDRSAASAAISNVDFSPCANAPSPQQSPPCSPATLHALPSFQVMSERDARLVFRSLAEAVLRSREASLTPFVGGDPQTDGCSSSGSILFGKCNRPCCRPLAFFAPEMLHPAVGTCDLDQLEIWSLGVLLYKMLTGRQPFEGKTDAQTLQLIMGCRVRFPLSWQSLSLSQEARGLIRWMLSLAPEDRPTIAEVLDHPWVKLPHKK